MINDKLCSETVLSQTEKQYNWLHDQLNQCNPCCCCFIICYRVRGPCPIGINQHRKTQMSHLTHWAIVGQYTDKMTQTYVKMSHFVRELTHYGSNESNDSFGFFCEANLWKLSQFPLITIQLLQ